MYIVHIYNKLFRMEASTLPVPSALRFLDQGHVGQKATKIKFKNIVRSLNVNLKKKSQTTWSNYGNILFRSLIEKIQLQSGKVLDLIKD